MLNHEAPIQIITFRRLAGPEFEAAYAIVREAAIWLHERDLPSWLVPQDIYWQRHMRGENYGLFMHAQLGAVVTLTTYRPQSWAEHLPETEFIWLATLASQRQSKGQNLGRVLLTHAEAFVRQQGIHSIYLDCYYSRGKLPYYYEQAGYRWIARQDLIFEDRSLHDSVLMCKDVVRSA